jgi:hypothetical protein
MRTAQPGAAGADVAHGTGAVMIAGIHLALTTGNARYQCKVAVSDHSVHLCPGQGGMYRSPRRPRSPVGSAFPGQIGIQVTWRWAICGWRLPPRSCAAPSASQGWTGSSPPTRRWRRPRPPGRRCPPPRPCCAGLVNALEDGVALAGSDGMMALASSRSEKMVGHRHTELAGRVLVPGRAEGARAPAGRRGGAAGRGAPRTRSASSSSPERHDTVNFAWQER